MNEVLHANIFFFIASVATVIFCILVCVLMYHLIKIVKAIRRLLDRIEAGSEMIAEDLTHIRSMFTGGIVSRLFSFFSSGAAASRPARKRKGNTSIITTEE